ncbi:hypothetical protein [Streptomyces sp. Tue6028]|uniref:hypothetical protein n=1 Tax=Streptomyces sp. Tue6028 TaxID=2036037 RepID=UPI0015CEC4D9|nr:hypothetical protein [Streptomyces sp. Tue6028]
MSDTSIKEPQVTADEATALAEGHGRHRGPVSGHDDEATPQGRHRKPSEQTDLSI